jgi:hypothetical protein
MKPAVRSDLVMCNVRDEIVVYDFRSHQARCLNQTAAAVFKLCDGTRTPRQIGAELTRTLGAPCDEEMVWMALAKLDDGGLLDPPLGERAPDLDRRRLLKKMALTAGLSIALPAVWSIVAPTPAYAASGAIACTIPPGGCMSTSEPGCCDDGTGHAMMCIGNMCTGTSSTCNGQVCQ